MKFMHLSDLHIGKRVNEFSMIEDQRYIMDRILEYVEEESPDGILIAGDVYDKSVAPAEAVDLFDDFLYELVSRNQQVFIISGNHDSPERLAFGGRLMEVSGVHLSPVYAGHISPYAMEDEEGKVNVYLMPFVKPQQVRRFFQDAEINNYTDALRTIIDDMQVNTSERNILVCHQFIVGADRTNSEETVVGGLDSVEASVFTPFDYVALGHIHRPQKVTADHIRYSGTPLKYSFSEEKDEKSVTIIELGVKGQLDIRTLPLIPKRDMRTIRGKFAEVTAESFVATQNREDYLRVILTDEEDIPNVYGQLQVIYPCLMKIEYDNTRTQASGYDGSAAEVESKSPYELFAELYEMQNGKAMSEEQSDYIAKLIEEIWG